MERKEFEGELWVRNADVKAVEARVKELERFKQYVHQCVEEHGSYKP